MSGPTPFRLVLAAVVLDLVLILPNHPAAMTPGALRLFPLELPVILLSLMALPARRWGVWLRAVLVAALVILTVLKLGDIAMRLSLGRAFNPLSDLSLAVSGVQLLGGTFGPVATGAIICGAVLALVGFALALWWATGVWSRLEVRGRARGICAAAAIAVALVAGAEVGAARGLWRLPVDPPGAAFTARTGIEKLALVRQSAIRRDLIRAAARNDPMAGRPDPFAAIDRDVLVIFVESYGRASFDVPFYADAHRGILSAAEARLGDAGLAMRSAWLAAPTKGGQSWLSHLSFASGLRVADQIDYDAVLSSGRETLFTLAGAAGFHTLAVVPAITMPWPEARTIGFAEVLAAADLGYRGKPFGWITMPDQFALSVLEHRLGVPREAPLFAEAALVSSHAPWTPVPREVPWDRVGDGAIFDGTQRDGPTPEDAWRDEDGVRDQYRAALGYSLRTVLEFAARRAGAEAPLMIILGDHQAAGFVAMDDRPHVPIHVIGPAHLVDRVMGPGWTRGLFPDPAAPVLPMEGMRDAILADFGGDPRQSGVQGDIPVAFGAGHPTLGKASEGSP